MQSTLGEEDVLGFQNIISVQVAGQSDLGALNVPCGEDDILVRLGKHKQVAVTVDLEGVEHLDHLLGLDGIEREVLDHADGAVSDFARQGRLAGQHLDLLVQLESVVVRLGAKNTTAASQEG